MRISVLLSSLIVFSAFFSFAKGVDPITLSTSNTGNYLKDTTTIDMESGTIQIGRECTDEKNASWTASSFKLGSTVIAEANSMHIKKDVVWVEIKQDDDCNYSHFSVTQPAQLTSLNLLARKFCMELILAMEEDNMENPFACPSEKCENIQIPISMNIY